MNYDVIIDCYTDEPSGLGVPPFLSVHARYIAGCLEYEKKEYYYMTIDDLRYKNGEEHYHNSYNKRILNITKNATQSFDLICKANKIYVVMGCFVKYEYLSAIPGTFEELYTYLANRNCQENRILFYCLGSEILTKERLYKSIPQDLFGEVVFGNSYNYFQNAEKKMFDANYTFLSVIARSSSRLLRQICRPLIIEIETASGCNRNPGCTFCIEGRRGLPLQFRNVDDIVSEIKSLYDEGARYFRLGRQPNFYAYQNKNTQEIEKMFKKIWQSCPDIKTLHIDNVSPQDVATESGEIITKLIAKYCTGGNIAPFGVESFDLNVREQCNLNGTLDEIQKAISIVNNSGKMRDKSGMPKLLPGINIIYGLDGQSSNTLKINLEHFKNILDSGAWVRRVFVRKLTSISGEQFDDFSADKFAEFEMWKNEIEEKFSIPMMKKVFPLGVILSDLRMEMYEDGDSILRQLGTCPIRVIVKGQCLELDEFYTVKIIGYREYRVLIGELIDR